MLSVFLIIVVLCIHIIDAKTLSPSVKVPSPEYVKLLNHSILFYEAQRSGRLPSDNRVAWRHDSALKDGADVNLDLTGVRYYDAGNYLKFTFPLSYSVFMLSWGGADYIEGYMLANQTHYLRNQIKWATDWLIKAHPQPSTLFVQVGDLNLDNDYFGPDLNIPTPRPCFQINETNFGTDAASMAATAFASASIFFRQLGSSKVGNKEDSKYADTLLLHATQLYNSSLSIFPYSRYQTSVPAVKNAYASTDYMDELVLSDIIMYKATQNKTYIDHALGLYKSNLGINKHSEPLDWDNKWGAVYVLFAEVMMDSLNNGEALDRRIETENYLDNIVSGISVNKTKGGLLFWDSFSNSNSNQNAMSTSHLLLSYSKNVLHPLLENSNDKNIILAKIKRYEDLANHQLDYLFGKNPIQQNYIVGERSNSPKYPHSASASGFTSLNDATDNPSDLSRSHIIYGALVGGPSKNDSFSDVRLDWTQTEVALDYNAPYQNVLAYQVMFSAKGPFYAPDVVDDSRKQDEALPEEDNVVPSWGIALTVILPLLALTGGFLFLCIRRRNRKKSKEKEERAVGQLEVNASGSTIVFNENKVQKKKGNGSI